MIGRIIAPFVLAGSLVASTTAEPTHPRSYTAGEVESLAAYERAPVSNLVAVAKPPEKSPSENVEIAEAVRKTVSDRANSLGKAYGMDMSEDLRISGSDGAVYANRGSPDGSSLELIFNPEGTQAIFSMIMHVRAKDGTSAGQIEKRFAFFHRQAFGFDLPTERPAGDRIRVERFIDAIISQWRVTVDGALLKESIFQASSNPQDGRWSIHGSPGPTSSEVEEFAAWLQKEPTRITEEEAVAIAWKNWKAIRDSKDSTAESQITCQLRKGTKEEREPWGVFGVTDAEPRAWKNLAAVSDSPDPVFYEVKIMGITSVSILVDRMDGKVIRIHQGKVPW